MWFYSSLLYSNVFKESDIPPRTMNRVTLWRNCGWNWVWMLNHFSYSLGTLGDPIVFNLNIVTFWKLGLSNFLLWCVFSMSHLRGLLGIWWAKFSSKRTDSSNITSYLIGTNVFNLAWEVMNNCLNLGSCKMLYLKIGFCQHRFSLLYYEYLWFGFDNNRVSFMMCFFYEPFFRGILGICRAKFSSKRAEVYSFQQKNGCFRVVWRP